MDFDKFFLDALLRWAHVLAGIIWIGHLYFFNFVNVPYQGKIDGETKKKSNPELIWRALWWFRWAAMATFLLGIALFLNNWFNIPSYKIEGVEGLTARGRWVMWGGTFGTIMWFNVWFVIWPAQQKIVPAIAKGEKPPEGLPQRALKFSRLNTYLSGPMLFCMVFAPHLTSGFSYGMLALVVAVGAGTMYLLIKASATAGAWKP